MDGIEQKVQLIKEGVALNQGCVDILLRVMGRRFSEGGMQQSTDAYVTFLREVWWLFGSLFTLTYLFFAFFLEGREWLKNKCGIPRCNSTSFAPNHPLTSLTNYVWIFLA